MRRTEPSQDITIGYPAPTYTGIPVNAQGDGAALPPAGMHPEQPEPLTGDIYRETYMRARDAWLAHCADNPHIQPSIVWGIPVGAPAPVPGRAMRAAPHGPALDYLPPPPVPSHRLQPGTDLLLPFAPDPVPAAASGSSSQRRTVSLPEGSRRPRQASRRSLLPPPRTADAATQTMAQPCLRSVSSLPKQVRFAEGVEFIESSQDSVSDVSSDGQ